ncbi:hypothetical protein PSELUDRAFT_1272 [Vogesella sp. LIG4]|nr:hypothetical protein PSELUDRAFT_1272 [Vogesella sp. LIG4]
MHQTLVTPITPAAFFPAGNDSPHFPSTARH